MCHLSLHIDFSGAPQEAGEHEGTSQPVESEAEGSKDSLRSVYHCDNCGKDLRLTTTEILKHKRHCKSWHLLDFIVIY